MTDEPTFVRREFLKKNWPLTFLELVCPNLLLLRYSLLVVLLTPLLSSGADSARLPRTDLLVYHRRNGDEARVETKSDWQRRRREVLKGVEQVMGPLPGRDRVARLICG
jgi:hypothetical protein